VEFEVKAFGEAEENRWEINCLNLIGESSRLKDQMGEIRRSNFEKREFRSFSDKIFSHKTFL